VAGNNRKQNGEGQQLHDALLQQGTKFGGRAHSESQDYTP
jgi:hypothetical protein